MVENRYGGKTQYQGQGESTQKTRRATLALLPSDGEKVKGRKEEKLCEKGTPGKKKGDRHSTKMEAQMKKRKGKLTGDKHVTGKRRQKGGLKVGIKKSGHRK